MAKQDLSRDQDTRDSESRAAMEFDPSILEEFGPLPDIKPRPGYTQRWVRVAIGNEADAKNMSRRSRLGWRPRQADSLPDYLQYMFVERKEFGNVIGTHDCILMERPIEIQRKIEAHERKKVRDLERAVKHNLFREHQNLGGSRTGFNQPVVESESRVIKGKAVVMDD